MNSPKPYQRKDGRWVAVLDLGRVGGKRVRRSYYGRTRAEAVSKRRKAEQQVMVLGRLPASDRLTVGLWMQRWFASVEADLDLSTRRSYRWAMRKLEPIASTPLAKLTVEDVETFCRDMGRTLAPSSARLVLTVLRFAYHEAERLGYVPRNVARLARGPRIVKTEPRVLPVAEARAILLAVYPEPLGPAWLIALSCGLRIGELLGLRWIDVDLDQRRFRIVQQVCVVEGGLQIKPPKTPSSARTIGPLPDFLLEAFREQRRRQAEQRSRAGDAWQEFGLVFTHRHGGPVNPNHARTRLYATLRRHGLPKVRPHVLRHTCASFLAAHRVPLPMIARLLGHQRLSTTTDVYTHNLDESFDEAMDVVVRLFGA